MMNKEILNAAQALLARREHGKQELYQKLTRQGYSVESVNDAIRDLEAKGLQSDARYAQMLLHSRVNKGYGPNFIRQYLRSKGIEQDAIDFIFKQNEIDWFDCLIKLWRKKFDFAPMDRKQKTKQQQFFYYRGFDAELINHLFEVVVNE